ncbi:hypothetical protein EJ04DRAFT_424713 [Polyplosphaeria fusca]|uniref:N-alpha-acetyltransferase 40 n=1 Tax=Polyplosphaeria fusca TaxID=682080 RepID=A0A9P4RC35_9PLEO|nr:hypothetical protein EJ04DRAFT_424713 [Polyplosphaeria fusca]
MLAIDSNLVRTALPDTDPLLSFHSAQRPLSVSITKKPASEMSTEELNACFNLVKTTSSADYKASRVGWHPREKLLEMRDPRMWYLLVRSTSPPSSNQSHPTLEPIRGFLSFMYTHDDYPDGALVVYIYEVHLDADMRGSGVGTHLIGVAEAVAERSEGVVGTMLTVFTRNKGAGGLYERLGYGRHATSPGDRVMRRKRVEAELRILVKGVGRGVEMGV